MLVLYQALPSLRAKNRPRRALCRGHSCLAEFAESDALFALVRLEAMPLQLHEAASWAATCRRKGLVPAAGAPETCCAKRNIHHFVPEPRDKPALQGSDSTAVAVGTRRPASSGLWAQ